MIPEDGRWHSGFSLAFDSDGVLHVLHNEPDSTWHRWNDGAGWQAEAISTQRPYSGTSLAIDAGGYLHGTYALYGGSASLVYVTNESGTWDEIVVDWCGAGAAGDLARLMLDSDGFAHVVYGDISANGIRYATNRTGTWEIAKFHPTRAWDAWFLSAAMGPDDAIHIADYNEDRSYLYYLSNKSGAWETTRLSGIEHLRTQPVFGNTNEIHVLVTPQYDAGVYYGRSDDGSFILDEVTPSIAVGTSTIAIGPDMVVHAILQSDDLSSMYYATQATDGSWEVSLLDSGEIEPGPNPLIAIDSLGRPHVAYHMELPRRSRGLCRAERWFLGIQRSRSSRVCWRPRF
ncbi:MAG: hypothetical protein M5R36_04505 [Deltaproteobacteria bacterium]|nr:hypothetical protein [Deltaproteobacteria bacterium]